MRIIIVTLLSLLVLYAVIDRRGRWYEYLAWAVLSLMAVVGMMMY